MTTLKIQNQTSKAVKQHQDQINLISDNMRNILVYIF